MFDRIISKYLASWAKRSHRKPLIVRGARQVGKTNTVGNFAKTNFQEYVYLNLEKNADAEIFQGVVSATDLVQTIQLKTGKKITPGSTLLFIDEIQYSAAAMTQLRYLYEELPALHVAAAGSLLEVKMKREGFSFPVGRVEYCYMHPVRFDEFLLALGDEESWSYLEKVEPRTGIPPASHSLLSSKYRTFLAVGGMPEAVAKYAAERSLLALNQVYETLLTGYHDDVYKYASNAKTPYIQHVLEHAPQFSGQTITYENFGDSRFRSREMREAFDVLENAMVLRRASGSPVLAPPILNNARKAPKLIFLDVGLVNYKTGVRETVLQGGELDGLYQGRMAEQAVGQTLLALSEERWLPLHYWYRNIPGATAEVDYIILWHNHLVPIEVKAGKTGTLKSLHRFMEESDEKVAVRIYSGPLSSERIKTAAGKKFRLLSLPFYLLHRLEPLVEMAGRD